MSTQEALDKLNEHIDKLNKELNKKRVAQETIDTLNEHISKLNHQLSAIGDKPKEDNGWREIVELMINLHKLNAINVSAIQKTERIGSVSTTRRVEFK